MDILSLGVGIAIGAVFYKFWQMVYAKIKAKAVENDYFKVK
jgi:hypothetical protein